MQIQPYLFFNGRCEEALEFYRKTLNAEIVMLMRFKDSPDPVNCASAGLEKIMHASFRVGETTLLASDGRCEGSLNFKGFALTLNVPNAAEAERLFTALSDGGVVLMPLAKTFYAEKFGMLADRFGVNWMIIVTP